MLTAGPVRKVSVRHLAKFCANRSSHSGVMAVFRFFKMAAVRHLGFVDLVYTCLDHPRSVVGDLYRYAKFGWNRPCSFEDMCVLIL